jgi:2-polyprenyl-3-methyl-5-hydroxy-6-metoxy-1,4-benzoquinol methylase
MNFYQTWMLPRLVDFAMRNRAATRYRSLIVPKACGTVLEIGVGSGLNLPFYGAGVEHLYGLDPSAELLAMAAKKARAIAFPIDFIAHASEEIPLEDSSVDTVVMTWTLCSVADPAKALKGLRSDQVRRNAVVCRTRSRPGNPRASLAAAAQPAMGQADRRMQPEPKNGSPHPQRGL